MRTILCLHASASSSRQWQSLRQALPTNFRVLTPNLIGYGRKAFERRGRFSLDDEVENVLRQIGDLDGPVDVVGHSYGGGVALRFAQRFSNSVRSLTLYEPAQPLLLFEDGLHTEAAREARNLRGAFHEHARSALLGWRAARENVNYWSGPKAWSSLRLSQKRRIAKLTPKVAAEWDALFSAGASLGDASQLTMPVHLLCGGRTRRTAKRVCELLADRLPNARLTRVEGLAHLAPITHAHVVIPRIMDSLGMTVQTAHWQAA